MLDYPYSFRANVATHVHVDLRKIEMGIHILRRERNSALTAANRIIELFLCTERGGEQEPRLTRLRIALDNPR